MLLPPAEFAQPAREGGECDRPGWLPPVDAADQDAIDASGVEVGVDRQGLAILGDLCGDLDPPPVGGEQGIARAVDVRDRRPSRYRADAGATAWYSVGANAPRRSSSAPTRRFPRSALSNDR